MTNQASSLASNAITTLLLVALAALVISWGSSSILAAFGGDNAVYWMTASHYSPWSQSAPYQEHFAATSIYPPLYPLLLGLAGGGESLLAAHQLTAAFLAATLPLVYWLARHLGMTASSALLIVVCFLAARITLMEAVQLHSEHLFTLLSLAAISLTLAAADHPSQQRTRLALAVVFVALAYLTRTFALALAAAFVVSVVMQRRPGRWWAAAAVVLAIVVWNIAASGENRYFNAMLSLYSDAGYGARLASNGEWFWRKWTWCFGQDALNGYRPNLALVIGALCLFGSALRARDFHIDGLYVGAAAALTLIWPYPAEYERLFYPLLPILFCHGVMASRYLVAKSSMPAAKSLAAIAVIGLVIACELPFAILFAGRLSEPLPAADYAPYRRSPAWYDAEPGTAIASVAYQHSVSSALKDIAASGLIPNGECMRAIKASIATVHIESQVHGMPRATTNQALAEQFDRDPCKYLFMTLAASPSFPEPFFPYQRLGDRIELVAVYPNPINPTSPGIMLGRWR